MAKKKKNLSKLGLGIALFVLGLILISERFQFASKISSTTFADEPVEIVGFENVEVDDAKLPKRIVIPELSIDLSIKKAQIKGGYWEVFPDAAGWGEGVVIPVDGKDLYSMVEKGSGNVLAVIHEINFFAWKLSQNLFGASGLERRKNEDVLFLKKFP